MCGVIGINAVGDTDFPLAQTEAMIRIFTDILQVSRKRGEDATGVAALYEDGDFILQKDAVPSINFIANVHEGRDYLNYLKFCRKNATTGTRLKTMIGHCRKSSIGNKFDNVNNHPIKSGNIIGVHNGTLKNHTEIFDNLNYTPDGTVDSEAIMALISHLSSDGTLPYSVKMMEQVGIRLEGPASTLSISVNNPYQMGFTRKTRTMEMVLIRSLNLLVTASEKIFLELALYEYNKRVKFFGDDCGGLLKSIPSKDLDFQVVIDDNVGYVDLTCEIDEKTTVKDILQYSDIMKFEKIWEKTYVSRTTGNQSSKGKGEVGNVTKQNTKVGNVHTAKTNVKDASKSSFAGRVFCSKLGKFTSDADAAAFKDVGPISVEEGSGSVSSITEPELGKLETEEVVKALREQEEVVKKVDNISFNTTDKPANTEVLALTAPEKQAGEVTDLLMVKVEREAAHSPTGLVRYQSAAEVAKALGIADGATIDALPAHALANRVKDHAHKEAFVEGATFYRTLMGKTPERAVAIAKKVALLFSKVVTRMGSYNVNIYGRIVHEVKKTEYEDLTEATLEKVFSKGDLRNNQPLAELARAAE